MADFQAKITNGASNEIWEDDATPSRINPLQGRPHRYRQCFVGDTITITCTVGTNVAPLDGALGGRLFYPKWSQWPAEGIAPPPNVTVTSGQSSVMTFVPNYSGHYLLTIRRQSGGGVAIPLEVLG